MVKNQSICDRIIFVGVIFLLIFAPLVFGSVHVWAYSLIEFGVFFLLALWCVERLLFSKRDVIEWVKTPVNLFMVLLLLLIGLQMIPLPSSLISFLSPQTFADKMRLFDLMDKAVDSTAQGQRWFCLAYYVHPAVIEWLKLAAYIGMFFLVLNTVRSKKRINILIYTLVLVGIFEAVYAVFQVFSITPRVWWWKSRAGGAHFASGTFIGSNHFAGYMQMLVPLIFGFMLAHTKRRSDVKGRISGIKVRTSGRLRAVAQAVVSWFSPESSNPKMIFLFFSATLMGIALLLSASRGGILSLGASMLLMSLLFFTKKKQGKYGLLALCLCLVTIVYSLHVGIDPTLEKFERTKGFYNRMYVTRSMIPMILDYPLLGVGWGNFRYLYSRYMPKNYDGVSSSGYSHNDWVEAGIEAGLVGEFLILMAFILYITKMICIWRQRRDRFAIGIGAGVMAGLLSIGFHSYFDFNMHIPANPMTLAALLGIGYVAVHRQGRGYGEKFFYGIRRIPLTPARRIILASIVFSAFAASVFITGRHFIAEAKCATEWNSTMNLNWKPYFTEIQEAIDRNPGNAEYRFKLAAYYMEAKVTDEILRKEYNEQVISNLEEAVRLNPARGIYWYDLGKRYSFKSYDPYNYVNKWLPLAEECFDTGIYCAPIDANMLFDVAWYWVWWSSMLDEEDPRFKAKGLRRKGESDKKGKGRILFREDGVRKFQQLFRRSMDINPRRWKKAVDRIWEYYPDDAVVIGIVPENNKELKSRVMQFLANK